MKPICQTCGAPATDAVVDEHEYVEDGLILALPGRVKVGCPRHPVEIETVMHASKEEAVAAMEAAQRA